MKFYVTTPIYYVNDIPHIGHAYTTIAADSIARWHRFRGDEVFFSVGTDEHGEKVEKAAQAAGKTPEEFVESIVGGFKSTWKALNISYDQFIRTTDRKHVDVVTEFLGRVEANGDIYKDYYEGWYCVPDETFWTELQLKGGRCPECGREVKKLREEAYFFRLSKYQDKLLDLYRKRPEFILPKFRANEIINRVEGELRDVSISRPLVKWGIPLPADKAHTVYVWVDALINYVSVLGWPAGKFKLFWPADVHLVGKDILWFHSVIWPALLFSAGLDVPRTIFAHGWWTTSNVKMSKSLGNVIDPVKMVEKFSTDAFRYFLLKERPLESDGEYSEHALIARINGELVADLGNLVYRVLSLAERNKVTIAGKAELDKELDIERIDDAVQKLELNNALEGIWVFVRAANKYINENEVWKLDGERLGNALYNLLEACRIIGNLVWPFMPETGELIHKQLGTKLGTLEDCTFREFVGNPVKGVMLFKKIEKAKADK